MAILTPTLGAAYLIWQIHKRDLRGWQHYACMTSLIFLISILFLAASGKVESFDVAGNKIKMVDQKLEEVKALTEQNKTLTEQNQLMAKKTVELISRATSGLLAAESYDSNAAHQSEVSLLKAAGLSDTDIKKFFDQLNQPGSKTNSP